MRNNVNEWISYHIFYFDAQLQEKLLCEYIGPIMKNYLEEKKIEKWFFIRYWEGGPHIRLRFIDKAEIKTEVFQKLCGFLQKYPSQSTLKREQYYRGHNFDGKPVKELELPWYGDNIVIPIDYEREYERYGGEKAITYCENIFMKSSEAAIDLMKIVGNNFSMRISAALNLILAMLYQAQIQPSYFFYYYKKFWDEFFGNKPIEIQYVNSIQAAVRVKNIAKQISGESFCGQWYKMIEDDMEAIEEIWQHDKSHIYGICISLVHMFNNRMGIIPDMERQIAAQFILEMEETGNELAN